MVSIVNRRRALRLLGGVSLGALTWSVILKGGFAILREVWPSYALADPERAYTLSMLLVRLTIFVGVISATSAVAALVAKDSRVALLAGAVIFAVSIPPHLYPGYLWEDYPAWYHIVYLISILPSAFLTARYVEHYFQRRVSSIEGPA